MAGFNKLMSLNPVFIIKTLFKPIKSDNFIV